jgi:hypothetical protein
MSTLDGGSMLLLQRKGLADFEARGHECMIDECRKSMQQSRLRRTNIEVHSLRTEVIYTCTYGLYIRVIIRPVMNLKS